MASWFLYKYTRDLGATRWFYRDLVALECVWDQDGGIGFVHHCVQLTFDQSDTAVQYEGWAFQPGWARGQLHDAPETERAPSMSLQLPPDWFSAAVARLQEAGVAALRPSPSWVGYWSYVVRDPDGRTIELSDNETPGPHGR